jgi:uncharacterized protein (TIGR02687 family)
MTSDQITSALAKLFLKDGHRIVLWNDPDREFTDFVRELEIDGVVIVHLDGESTLQIKKRVELDEPDRRFLLYSAKEPPPMEVDWLLDIRHYAHTFRADKASILIDDLGLMNHSLRPHLVERRKFFESKDRIRKLQELVEPTDIESDLDRKMIAVLLKAEHPELFSFLRVLFHEMAEEESLDLAMPTAGWSQIERMDLAGFFWDTVRATFGYSEERPALKNLLLRLLVTDFCSALRADPPDPLKPLLLPETGRPNVRVFLSQWRDSSSTGAAYDTLSEKVAAMLRIDDMVAGYGIDELGDVNTFMCVEKRLMSLLRDRVLDEQDTVRTSRVREVAARRMDGHWASANLPTTHDTPRTAFRAVYQALVEAAEFLELRRAHLDGFRQQSADKLWKAYVEEYYRFDQLYRHFCEQADVVEAQSWSVLKPLRELIEQHYVNGFVAPLALAWGEHVESGLIGRWEIAGVKGQQDFFRSYVTPVLKEGPNRKVFVIISDAFRYEAARELLGELNGKYRFKASLDVLLGVLPSYTALGMASLLPHETLSYKPNGEVLVDGKPSAGLDLRNTILEAHQGIALRADDVMAMKRDEGRDRIRGKRVIYIYHNEVDAAGDSASTEAGTFDAVRSAIQSLGQLTRQIVDKLNGSLVFITADHGFLFQESQVTPVDKSKLPDKPEGTVIAKKRYLLGTNLPDHPEIWHGSTKQTAGAEGDMEFWIPHGTSRFHFVGGARFIHGGAMLQEVVVPLITVNEIEGKSKAATQTKQVEVILVGQNHKVTTSRHRFQVIQAEPVSDRIKPVTLKIGIFDGETPVTELAKETFNSGSDSMADRTRYVALTLLDRSFDNKKTYYLRFIDDETGIEKSRYSITIDKAFHDDF